MDERELRELFRDAPGEPPPPTFSADDVAAASRRAVTRRRTAIAGVAAAVVLGGGFAGILGVALSDRPGGDAMSAASAPVEGQSDGAEGAPEQPGDSSGRHPNAEGFPQGSTKQGGEPGGKSGQEAGSTSGCDKVDRELATALAGELPVTASDAVPGRVCPDGTRFAGYTVEGGTITAVLVPEGVAPQLPQQPEGTATAERKTADGRTVLLISTPANGSADAPRADELDRIATALAREL